MQGEPAMHSNYRPCLCTVLPLLVLMLGVAPVLATAPDQDECAGPDPDRAIAACTSMLQQNRPMPPRVKVAILNHRGMAYVKNHDYDRAMADYDAALHLAPHNPFIHNLRGIA